MDVTDRAAEVTEQVLDAMKKGQQTAVDAVRVFTEKVNEALPGDTPKPAQRQQVIDSAFQMADRLVAAQYEFFQEVVSATARSLNSRKDEDAAE